MRGLHRIEGSTPFNPGDVNPCTMPWRYHERSVATFGVHLSMCIIIPLERVGFWEGATSVKSASASGEQNGWGGEVGHSYRQRLLQALTNDGWGPGMIDSLTDIYLYDSDT